MNKIKRKKKIIGDWYEYAILNENGKEGVAKLIGKANPELVKGTLSSLKCLIESTDTKTKEANYHENYILINDNFEILLMDIINICVTDSFWFILELDGKSKSWKKLQKRKADKIFCIVDDKGKITVSPTNKIIKYIPCINMITLGNDVFKMHHSHDDYSGLIELIPDSTYLISKGNKKGLVYGQAFYDSKNKSWNNYSNIGLFPLNYEIIEAYRTFVSDLYIMKLDDKYTFYRAKRNSIGLVNELYSKRYKSIKMVKNNYLHENIGFLCLNENDSLEFYNGYGDFEFMNTSNISDALIKINDIIAKKYECDAGTDYKYFDFVS